MWIIWAIFGCLVFSGVCMEVKGSDIVENLDTMRTAAGGSQVLGAPRHNTAVLSGAGRLMSICGAYGLYLWEDYGQNMLDSAFSITNAYDHDHLYTRLGSDTVWRTRNYRNVLNNINVDLYDGSGSTISLLATGTLDSAGNDDYIFSVAHFGGADSMVLITRWGTADDLEVAYALSGDNGQTWEWGGDVIALNRDCRLGVFEMGDSAVAVIFDWSQEDMYVYAYSANVGWSAVGSQPIESSTALVRDYAASKGKDGIIHVFCSDSASTAHVLHWWIHPDSADWTADTVFTSDKTELNASYRGMFMGASYSEYEQTVRLAFATSLNEGSATSKRLLCVKYNYDTHSWSDTIQINPGNNYIEDVSGSTPVPTSHGGRGYFTFAEGTAFILATLYEQTSHEDSSGQLLVEESDLPITIGDGDHSSDYNLGNIPADTIVIAGDRIRSTSSGILFSNTSNWVVDGKWDTLDYGYAGDNTAHSSVGVSTGSGLGSQNIEVKNLWIRNVPIGMDSTTWDPNDTLPGNTRAISLGYEADSAYIHDCSLVVAAPNSHGISVGRGTHIRIENVFIDQRVMNFRSRCQFDACGIYMENHRYADLEDADDYHVSIYNVRIKDCPHNGIFGSGYTNDEGVYRVDACTISVAVRNVRYDLLGGGATCEGRANGYGIQFTRGGRNSYIKHCHITAADPVTVGHHGGRGIQLVNSEGTEAEPVVICSSYVNVHEDADNQFTGVRGYYPCAIKIRQNCDGVSVYDNEFIYVGDGSVNWGTQTGGYYPSGEAGLYEHWSSASPPFYVTWRRNLFRTVDRATGGSYAYMTGFKFDNVTQGWDESFVFDSNTIETDMHGIIWGGYDGEANKMRLKWNSIKLVDTSNTDGVAFDFGYGTLGYQVDSIFLRDFTFYDSDGNPAIYDTNLVWTGFGIYSAKVEQSVVVTVLDASGDPLPGASITIENNYGQAVHSGLSNSNGVDTAAGIPIWYESSAGDSIGFWPLIITADYGEESDADTSVVNSQNYSFTLNIGAEAVQERKLLKGVRGEIFIDDNNFTGRFGCYGRRDFRL